MDKQAKIYVTNHQERAGSAIYHYLLKQGYENVVVRTGMEAGRESIQAMNTFFAEENIEYVLMTDGYEYAESNAKAELQARRWHQANVLEASARYNVKKLLYVGDIHVYPKYTPQPLKETFLQRGIIDEVYAEQTQVTREGIALCRASNRASNTNFHIAVAPRMYTAADMNRQDGMVADAMQRCLRARDQWQSKVEIPEKEPAFQELIYGDDMASGCVFVMNHYNEKGPVNIGTEREVSAKELVMLIKRITGYRGAVFFTGSGSGGMRRKTLDTSKINRYGWYPEVSLAKGLQALNQWEIERDRAGRA
ncbi:NAD-dependent epimerase/dehydratase family protein [Marinococcus sp. PL1-022]|uniref:NAD-dependent epimerase/dehydratase family protein n=1 Tax=Marinococcus sp. PL1-022 TaxID=3095363 RepID=UPI0029C55E68|nr:NAD-dependent epimerase/dehydratase family protein [Marinococcus sp. PL1-022]MDX6154010.1 NAD-dependent epimerase/dehydratase family protein [Marinococcus sp. PL1-022]